MGKVIWCVLLAVISVATTASAALAQAPPQMEVLARVGPWPVVSQMIGFRGRVWFANSVKGVNHNSSDLWSFDPHTREVRYERHLFSQDAGDPLIHRGLLYWPFEDSRTSLGWGGMQVTNGEDWRFLLVPSAEMFHIHLAAEFRGALVAVTSAWRAGLQVSRDGGRTWNQAYDRPTPPQRVSRMSEFAVAGDLAVGRMREPGEKYRLVRWNGDALSDVPGWAQGPYVMALTAHKNAVFFAHSTDKDSGISVVENGKARTLSTSPTGWRVRDLASDGERLWAIATVQEGGEVWSSAAGEDWRLEAILSGGTPSYIALADGAVYVGGAGDDGRGILWGMLPETLAAETVAVRSYAPPKLPAPQVSAEREDLDALGAELDAALQEPVNFFNHGRVVLRGLVHRIARSDPPSDFLASRLTPDLPNDDVPVIGGSKSVAAGDLGHWIVLWGIGLSRKGTVPLHYFDRPWITPEHGSEKYFDPLLMALWAVTQTGQADEETIGALIDRLDRDGDPDWLQGDVIGVLSALTGERFGYDTAAWRDWWAAGLN